MSRANLHRDLEMRLRRRSLLKYMAIGGALAFAGGLFPVVPSLELLPDVYGKRLSSIPVQQSNTDAYQLITQALAGGQTSIHLPAGNYSVSQQIDIPQTGVEIYGDGADTTILRLNDGVFGSSSNPQPAHVLCFQGQGVTSTSLADNFYVHDLTLDGNQAGNMFQGNPYTPYSMACLFASNCNGGTAKNCTFQNGRFMGVQIEIGSNCTIDTCQILNSGANGISIGNAVNGSQRGRGSGHQVLNCTVDGASDVGISVWEGIDTLVQGNSVNNVNLSISPYMQDTHTGILAEGAHDCDNVTFQNNTISNCSVPGYVNPQGQAYQGVGLGSSHDGSTNLQFKNNVFDTCYKTILMSGQLTTIGITGNTIRNPVSTADPVISIVARNDQSPTSVDIENNIIENVPANMTAGIILLAAGQGICANNTIYSNGNPTVIRVNAADASNWVTTPNTIYSTSTSSTVSSTSTSVPEFSDLATVVFSTLAASLYALKRRRR